MLKKLSFKNISELLFNPTSSEVSIRDISFTDKLDGNSNVNSSIYTDLKLSLSFSLGYSIHTVLAYKALQVELKGRCKKDLISAVESSKFGAYFVDFDADHYIMVEDAANNELIEAICKLDGSNQKHLIEYLDGKAFIRFKNYCVGTELEHLLMTILNGDLLSSNDELSKEIKSKFHRSAINHIKKCRSLS